MSAERTESFRVLQVDSDRGFVERTASTLEDEADVLSVTATTNGDDAIRRLNDEDIDCVLCSSELPDTAGVELLSRVRDEYPELPFVLLVGSDSGGTDGTAMDALAAGVTDCVPKTVLPERSALLADRIESVVSRRRTEIKYREAFDRAADGIFIHDPEPGKILDANPRACEMTGYSDQEIIGVEISDFSVTEEGYTQEAAAQHIHEAATEGPQVFEWYNDPKDGERFWSEINLKRTELGSEDRVLASARDITERKRREREYEQIFNMAGDGIVIHDPESGDVVDVNQQIADLLGYDREDFLDRPMSEFFALDEGVSERRARELVRESVRKGGQEFEWPLQTADGETIWTRARHEIGEIGGEQRVVALLHDVTARKRREREYEQIFNGVNDIINVYDPETKDLVQVNDAMCELTGYDRETILEEGLESVSASGEGYTSDYASEVIEEVMESGEPTELEWCLETIDGDRRWLEVKATPATINNEDRLVTISRDVTKRRQREREYEQIFNGVTDAITVHDPNTGELLDINETMCDLTGYSREELLTSGMELINLPGEGYSSERAREIVQGVMETNRQGTHGWLIERKDGERRWLEVNNTPATLDGEDRYLAIIRDITERRRTERRLNAILNRIDEAIFFAPADELGKASASPDFVSSGYEAIWGQSLKEVQAAYENGFFETLHPDDEAGYRALIDEILRDIDTGTAADRYSQEYRIERPDGEVRWVGSEFYPTEWETGQDRIAVVSRDVTDRKERERRIASFDSATEDLAAADDREEAVQLAVEAATDALDLSAVGAFLYDEDTGILRPEVVSDAVPDDVGSEPVRPGDGPIWDAFATSTVVDPEEADTERVRVGDGGTNSDTYGLEDWRAIVLGNYGVLLVGSLDSPLDPSSLQTARVVGATLEAALNHIRSEREIAARERELRERATRLDRLDRLNDLIRDLDRVVVEETTRKDIEQAVCDRLTAVEPYSLVWCGESSLSDRTLTPTVSAGGTRSYVDNLTITHDNEGLQHPATLAFENGTVATVNNLVNRPQSTWRTQALSEGYQSICTVPIAHEGIVRGVLVIHADRPNAFDDQVQAVLEELGRSIGHAITSLERKRALESSVTTELEFNVHDTDLCFVELAARTGCAVEFEHAVRRTDGMVSTYFALDGELDDDVRDALDDPMRVDEIEVLAERDGSWLIEVSMDSWFGELFADHGAVVRTARADGSEGTLRVELPMGTNVRTLVEAFQRKYPDTELTAKREKDQVTETPPGRHETLVARLTDRQLEVLETAYSMGYFEWPRDSSGEEVATTLDITQPTFNRHLRTAERKTFSLLLD